MYVTSQSNDRKPGRLAVSPIFQSFTAFLCLVTFVNFCNKEALCWAMADHYHAEMIKDLSRMATGAGVLQSGAVFRSNGELWSTGTSIQDRNARYRGTHDSREANEGIERGHA